MIDGKKYQYEILIVSNIEEITELSKKFCKVGGRTFKCVSNCVRAFEELEYNIPKIILIDISVCESGFDFLRRIKSDKRWSSIRIALIPRRTEEMEDRLKNYPNFDDLVNFYKFD